MNYTKQLIELKNVPQHCKLNELVKEIFNDLKHIHIPYHELTGVVFKSKLNKIHLFLLFRTIPTIEKYKKLCQIRDNKYFTWFMNTEIEVEFPGIKISTLEASEYNNNETNINEVKINDTSKLNMYSIIKLFPKIIQISSPLTHIKSIVRNRNSTFINFSNGYKKKNLLEVIQHNPSIKITNSKTYTYVSTEIREKETQEERITNFQAKEMNTEESTSGKTFRNEIKTLALSNEALYEINVDLIPLQSTKYVIPSHPDMSQDEWELALVRRKISLSKNSPNKINPVEYDEDVLDITFNDQMF